MKYLMDGLDGTHATDRIQLQNIEGVSPWIDAIVYKIGTSVIAKRTNTASVLDSGTADTADDRRVIQSALDIAQTSQDGEAKIVIMPGVYKVPTTMYIYNNTVLYAYNATFEMTMQTTNGNIFPLRGKVSIGNQNIKIFGLTVDQQNKGGPLRFFGDETSAINDVLIQDCNFVNQGPRYELQFTYTFPSNALPTKKNRGIRVVNCNFDGTGAPTTNTLEMLIISNGRECSVSNCRFVNGNNTIAAPFSFFGQDVDSCLINCQFYNNISNFDFYMQQGTNVRVIGNEFENGIKITDSRYVVVSGNRLRRLAIVDFDSDTFDLNKSLWRGSQHIIITGNQFNTQPVSPGMTSFDTDTAIYIKTNSTSVNPPKYIFITNNEIKCRRILLDFPNMPDGSPNMAQPIEKLIIANNAITECSTQVGQGIIELNGVAGIPSGGFKDVFITNNYFAPSSRNTACNDVILGRTDFSNIVIRGNYFNNSGVTNANCYPGVSGNVGLNSNSRDSNSGNATVASGSTSVAVTHGVCYTPNLDNIIVTPTNNLGNATKFWVSNPTATQFTINAAPDPGNSGATFAWVVRRSGN
jgi:hypothetical protein